ncbi:hypothetical protein [Fluoribacter gormanii]|nr:hypothetical protein [Fluoribacter gormanii]
MGRKHRQNSFKIKAIELLEQSSKLLRQVDRKLVNIKLFQMYFTDKSS